MTFPLRHKNNRKSFKHFEQNKKELILKGEKDRMKKIRIVLFCVLSLLAIALAGNVTAYNAAYSHTDYLSSTVPTIDGTYAQGPDWLESGTQTFGTNGIFRDEWTFTPVAYCMFIETTDSTNDPGDYWVVTFDSTTDGGATEPNGGAAPQTDDYMLKVTGHGATATTQWYKGNGTGWNPVASPSAANFQSAQALAASPKIATPHYGLEIFVEKTNTDLGTVIMGYNWASFVGYYDAHTGGNGNQTWPPASATPPGNPNVPNSWGYIPYAFNANPTPDVPENFAIVTVLALSLVAAIGAVLLRKARTSLKP